MLYFFVEVSPQSLSICRTELQSRQQQRKLCFPLYPSIFLLSPIFHHFFSPAKWNGIALDTKKAKVRNFLKPKRLRNDEKAVNIPLSNTLWKTNSDRKKESRHPTIIMLIMINNQLCNSESSLSCVAMNQGPYPTKSLSSKVFPSCLPDIETSASDSLSHMENYHPSS